LPRVVSALRRAVGLRSRLHGRQGRRPPQRGLLLRPAAVRLHVPHRLGLLEIRQQADRSHRARAAGGAAGHRARGQRAARHPMNDVTVLAASADTRRGLTIGLFLVFIAITLYITFWASRQNKTAADFYAAGRSFSAFQNGLAIGGDYMSAASFLGIAG